MRRRKEGEGRREEVHEQMAVKYMETNQEGGGRGDKKGGRKQTTHKLFRSSWTPSETASCKLRGAPREEKNSRSPWVRWWRAWNVTWRPKRMFILRYHQNLFIFWFCPPLVLLPLSLLRPPPSFALHSLLFIYFLTFPPRRSAGTEF
jgi:hypothetical protein